MAIVSFGRFLCGYCVGIKAGQRSAAVFVVLAGLLCFGAPALAQRGDMQEPGAGELRYDLPDLSPAPVEPMEPVKPIEPPKNATPPPRGVESETMVNPALQGVPPAPKSLIKEQAAPEPRQTSAPPRQIVSPESVPAPVPTPVPAPVSAPRQAERKSLSEPAEELTYPLKAAVPPVEAAPFSPAPEKAPEAMKTPKAATAQPRQTDKTFVEATPRWMRQAIEKPVSPTPAPAPAPVLEESAAPVARSVPEQDVAQPEVSGEPALGLEERAQESYATERDFVEDESIGYGAVDVSAPQPRRSAGRATETGSLTAPPPQVTAHARGPEEQAQAPTPPRDERVPTDIGPYAWVPGSEAPPAEPGSEDLPWELSADKVTAYNQNSVVDAEGEVFLQRGNEYLKADFGRYFAETGWVYLKGNVEIYFGSDRLSGEEAEFDLSNKVGWVKNGKVFMAGPHVYLSGEKVNKNWGDTYTFRNAKLTTCDGDVPAWSLHAEDAVVELDGYARLWGSSLAIKDQKVAYSPYMVVPAKRDRQSGFLVPRAGQDSRKGFYWDQPYFWAIDESRDLTVNTYIMTDRGVMLGAEYRSKQEWDENLWVRADYLNDSETWDTRSDNYFNNGYLRKNADRFWLRGMYDGTPFSDRNWKVKANLDYVSDGFFLREFKNGPQGYSTTRDYLEDSFGRTLAPWSSNRISEGVIYRDWDRVTLSAGMRYEQNPFLGNGNQPRSSDVIAQKLPDINAYLHKGGILEELPLEAEGEAQMVYFYRRDGVKGMRYDLSPRLSLPLRNDYGALVPELGLRGTLYQAGDEGRIQGDTGNSDESSRAVPEFSLAGFTEVARNYALDSAPLTLDEENVGNRRWSGIRHVIQPRVDYFKRWKVDQDDLPYFDSIDRLAPRDEVVYSITNLLTVKRESVVLNKDKNPVVRDDYIDFVRFKLETGYDFDEANRTWNTDAYKRRPFMDILADITLAPGNWFSVTSRTWWSPYNGDFTRLDNSVTVWEQGIGRASVGLNSRRRPDEYKRWSTDVLYRDLSLLHRGLIDENDLRINRYRKPVDLLYADLQLDYFTPFSFSFQQWYDLRANEAQETHLSVIYTHQCYQLEAYMWWDQHDESYGFSVRLPGFWD